MRILVIGREENLQECRQKFGSTHSYRISALASTDLLSHHDVVFDFLTHRDSLQCYDVSPPTVLFLNAATTSIGNLIREWKNLEGRVVLGFPGLPGFLDRTLLEVSTSAWTSEEKLKEVCKQLGTEFQRVEDRPGLVSPRVICMIINEAYYTVEEGTASREDVDLAMKLGTAYPHGPFEWCGKIGVKQVYEVLLAMMRETGNERYRISSLLESEYHSNQG